MIGSRACRLVERVTTRGTPAAGEAGQALSPGRTVCLEDGKKLKMLKRHLQISYGLSPDAYRTKWGLPREYPMVAPNYAATRSGLAKQIGLGRKRAVATEPEVAKLPARRARGSKS